MVDYFFRPSLATLTCDICQICTLWQMYAFPLKACVGFAKEGRSSWRYRRLLQVTFRFLFRMRRAVLFDDDIYLKGRGFKATMDTRNWLENNQDFTQVRESCEASFPWRQPQKVLCSCRRLSCYRQSYPIL